MTAIGLLDELADKLLQGKVLEDSLGNKLIEVSVKYKTSKFGIWKSDKDEKILYSQKVTRHETQSRFEIGSQHW